MKKTNILYWVFTGLFAAAMLMSAIPSILSLPSSVAIVSTHLGYPLYFVPYTGVAKLLGVVAILIPGFPRIKEWAYAGLAYDLIAATYSLVAIGDPPAQWLFMSIWLILGALSYIYYHKKLVPTA